MKRRGEKSKGRGWKKGERLEPSEKKTKSAIVLVLVNDQLNSCCLLVTGFQFTEPETIMEKLEPGIWYVRSKHKHCHRHSDK